MTEPTQQYNIDKFSNFFKLPLLACVTSAATTWFLTQQGTEMNSVSGIGIFAGLLVIMAGLTKPQTIDQDTLQKQEESLATRSYYLPALYGASNMTLGYFLNDTWNLNSAGVGIGIAGSMLLAEYIVHEKNKKWNQSGMGVS